MNQEQTTESDWNLRIMQANGVLQLTWVAGERPARHTRYYTDSMSIDRLEEPLSIFPDVLAHAARQLESRAGSDGNPGDGQRSNPAGETP